MSYVDLATVHVPSTGGVAPAAWGLQIRENQEFLIDVPSCSVFNSAAQSVADATSTTLDADSENFDNDGMHSNVSNTSRITAQTAGRYLFTAAVSFDPDADGYRRIRFRVNDTTDLSGAPTINAASTPNIATGMTDTRAITLAVGDFVELRTAHTAGAALDVFLREFNATFLTRA